MFRYDPFLLPATAFVSSQAEHRTQFIYVVQTTPAQEQAIRRSLETQNQTKLPNVKKHPIDGYRDNCATRTSDALKAGGVDVARTHTPNQVANQMEKLVSHDKATATAIAPKADVRHIPLLKELNPK